MLKQRRACKKKPSFFIIFESTCHKNLTFWKQIIKCSKYHYYFLALRHRSTLLNETAFSHKFVTSTPIFLLQIVIFTPKVGYNYFFRKLSQIAHGVPRKNSRRKMRLVFHRGTWSANCDWCPTKNHAAQNATAVPRWDSRRKMRNHSANLRSLISVWKLDFSKKKYAAQFAIRLFKNKKSNSGLEIRLFRKKACGAFCD